MIRISLDEFQSQLNRIIGRWRWRLDWGPLVATEHWDFYMEHLHLRIPEQHVLGTDADNVWLRDCWSFSSWMKSECCEPPTECGYTSVNPTYWISPMSSAANQDCMQRSNEQTQLCRGCDSCMAAMIANLRREWRRADAILLCTPTGLVVVCLVGCCLFRKAKTEELFRRYKLRHSWPVQWICYENFSSVSSRNLPWFSGGMILARYGIEWWVWKWSRILQLAFFSQELWIDLCFEFMFVACS